MRLSACGWGMLQSLDNFWLLENTRLEVSWLRAGVASAVVPLQLVQGRALSRKGPSLHTTIVQHAIHDVRPRESPILRDDHPCPRAVLHPAQQGL